MIRAFVALPLPDATRAALEDFQNAIPVGRLSAPETFHITLAYLDKQTPLVLERIHEVLQQIQAPEITITLRGVSVFGDREPKVLWAKIEPDPALEHLRDKVRRAAMRSGVELPRERFRPHVTLARFKGRMSPRDRIQLDNFLVTFADTPRMSFEVDTFVLYQSTRHQTGALHDPMVSYKLGTT